LTSSAQIQALFQQGKRVEKPALLVLWRATETPRRAGFAVTRQIRGAVRRNRARRRLREAFRAVREAAPERVALVIVGKRAVLDEAFGQLRAELREALRAIPGARTGA
jgi:ribonuclease P protein component